MLGRSRKRFKLHHPLRPPDDDYGIASFSVGPAGEAVVLWARGSRAAISTHGTGDQVVWLEDASVPELPFVQPLPGGRLLAVAARAAWRDGDPERNAVVYAADGSVERTACLGDGIQHVRTTVEGEVWVGYFDEGVYGNLGWGTPDGPAPIGAPGIVRFSPTLDVEWEFPSDLAPIDDCYALNVLGDDVWTCCYSDFDVVRIRGGAVRAWTNAVEGARAIAVGGDSIALFGGYGKDRDHLTIGHLDDDELEVDVTGRLTMPNGRRLPEDTVVVGRGDELHAVVGLEWFTWSLTDRA